MMFLLGLLSIVIILMLKWDALAADLKIRKAIKQLANLIPGAKPRVFDTTPRVRGVIEGYDIQIGVNITHRRYGGLSAMPFEKVKLKRPPRVFITEKDSLSLNDGLVLEWGWLTRYQNVTNETRFSNSSDRKLIFKYRQMEMEEFNPTDVSVQAIETLNDLAANSIYELIKIAEQVDSGVIDLEKQISENSSLAHREFLIGSLAALGVTAVYCLIWRFFL